MRYAAFLRGINLGSRRRVRGGDLRMCFEEIGFEGVSTFRTSGNVVFDTGRESQSKLTGQIEAALANALGFEVAIFLRTEKEIRDIAVHHPFPPRLGKSFRGKLQVALLSGKPAAPVKRKVLALTTDHDLLAFGNCELYWLPRGATMDSALDYGKIEKLLGPTTRRTKGTLEEMARKYFAG